MTLESRRDSLRVVVVVVVVAAVDLLYVRSLKLLWTCHEDYTTLLK